MNKILSVSLALLVSMSANAQPGVITDIWFAGPDDPNHPNVVQIKTANAFTTAGCDSTLAAIKNDKDRAHMISYALAAYISKDPIAVVLNPADTYFGSGATARCTISRISTD